MPPSDPQDSTPSIPSEPPKYYVTTPIYYVNARPHIGHAYTTIVADVLARRHRLLGDETLFLTGTDEHGQKIERSAAAAGVPPQQFADQVSEAFRSLWERMGLTFDRERFIRTTDPAHQRGVQQLFRTLWELGHIYLSSYTGSYCVSDEAFVDLPAGTPCPDCGRPLETVTEENFFFRLSAFQQPLLDLIESGTLAITPDSSRNEVLSFLRGDLSDPNQLAQTASGAPYLPGALKDLSVSRSSFTWGIPVPEPAASLTQQPHVIYVWLDALANYMTAVGYGDPARQHEFRKWWPADLHLVGKEIVRFHCVYWPAFLLALDPATTAKVSPTSAISEPDAPRLASETWDSTEAWATPEAEISPEEHGLPPEPAPGTSTIAPGAPRLDAETWASTKAWAADWLPKQITAHGWLLFDHSKMSKSKGNIVRTETILDAFGQEVYAKQFPDSTKAERDLFAADVLRYYLLREIPFGQDGSFSFESLVTRYNADLANGYGNLVSRVLSLIFQFCNRTSPPAGVAHVPPLRTMGGDAERATRSFPEMIAFTEAAGNAFNHSLTGLDLAGAAEHTTNLIARTDALITSNAPWKLLKQIQLADQTGDYGELEPEHAQALLKLEAILYTATESIRILTALLHPILPFATAKVWAQLGLGSIEDAAARGDLRNLEWGGLQPGTRLGPLAPIFPRADKSLIETMTDMEAPSTPAPRPRDLTGVNDAHDAAHPDTSPFPEAPISSVAAPHAAALTGETSAGAPVPSSSTAPGAGPRTGTLPDEASVPTVGGSSSPSPERPGTPPHTEAAASGIFARSPQAPSPSSPDPGATDSTITIDDFSKVELRVAEIRVAERIPKADKLLRLEVDLGPELGTRQILSGIAEWYTPEDLLGRRIVVITNLAPRRMRGLESHGMLLAASGPEVDGRPGKPILATMAEEIPPGSRLK